MVIGADKSRPVFAGTGSPATVLRLPVRKGEKPFTLFETKDLSVQALCLGPDGALYAATLPSGKVYKLNPDATDETGRIQRHGGVSTPPRWTRPRRREPTGSTLNRAVNLTTSGI